MVIGWTGAAVFSELGKSDGTQRGGDAHLDPGRRPGSQARRLPGGSPSDRLTGTD